MNNIWEWEQTRWGQTGWEQTGWEQTVMEEIFDNGMKHFRTGWEQYLGVGANGMGANVMGAIFGSGSKRDGSNISQWEQTGCE